LLQDFALQVDAGATIIMVIIVALIISLIFYTSQKRNVSKIKDNLERVSADLNTLRTNLPRTTEVGFLQENMKRLCDDFGTLKTSIEDQMNKLNSNTTEDLNKTRDLMMKTGTEKVVETANNYLTENSVSREEFDRLQERIEKTSGPDEMDERMEVLSNIFDTTNIRTLNWQCKLIKLLNGGFAPEAEEEQIALNSIPTSKYTSFIKKLTENGLVEEKLIDAYYLVPEFEWIHSYVDNPDWLRQRLENTAKKEREYKQFIREHLDLIESGLLLEQEEYEVVQGSKIDFVCRDSSGRAVVLELKYPDAKSSVRGQIFRYKNDYENKIGRKDSRFIVVAPKIPENVKLLLANDGLEYKEVSF